MENGDKSLAMIKINFSKALTKQDGLKVCCDFEKMVVLFAGDKLKRLFYQHHNQLFCHNLLYIQD